MTRTLYTTANADFSEQAHRTAQATVYPDLFRCHRDALGFESMPGANTDRAMILDGEMGVDRIVRVTVAALNGPLLFTVQERFRRPEYQKWQDLTITEWNHASGLPSELYKINAGLFLYGYYDAAGEEIRQAICIDVPALLLRLAWRDLPYQMRRNSKEQTFLGISFDLLRNGGLVVWETARTMAPILRTTRTTDFFDPFPEEVS